MAYRQARALLVIATVAFLLVVGCGRSDLTVYVWGDGGPDVIDAGGCGAMSCASGCCDPSGTCRSGTELNACGFGGMACADCQAMGDAFCNPQVKACGNTEPDGGTCDAATCPSGCCTTFMGQPACVSGSSSLACGTGGVACVNCTASGELCDPSAKTCVSAPCGPNDCNGCCAGGSCVAMETDKQCGTGGLSCSDCASMGEFCNTSTGLCVSVMPLCGPMNCKGCCAGDVCVTSESDTQCGVGGLACTDCAGMGDTCSGGTCVTTCNAKTCPGCCESGTCFAGFVDSRCGSGGAACADCSSMMATCDTLATPRVCSGMTTCPAAYGGCATSVSTPVLSTSPGACKASDLADAKAACSTGFGSAPCDSFIASEPSIDASCATCLTPFYHALQDGQGIFNCVSPYVSSTCNHDTGCIDDCETQSCDMCPKGSIASCKSSVAMTQCATYWSSASCIASALFGGASFCSPTMYGGNYGAWLAGVGAKYCL